ncbi:hypothetical protein [Paracoccus sanguinis]|uniref:hypothetical protein n=1 Tax=Paracoccus sanguinis TaxID=1545044 RepID=UPI000B192F91|nr:hypothetical protein [Paracoccus sanguinis]
MTFIEDDAWTNLLTDLLDAAGDHADPETKLAEIISQYVAPEAARDDIAAQTALEAA